MFEKKVIGENKSCDGWLRVKSTIGKIRFFSRLKDAPEFLFFTIDTLTRGAKFLSNFLFFICNGKGLFELKYAIRSSERMSRCNWNDSKTNRKLGVKPVGD